MNRKYHGFFILLLISLLVFLPLISFAGEPTENIKAVTDKLITIISDKALQAPEMKDKRGQAIMETIDAVFSW